MADFYKFFERIDNPKKSAAAGEEIAEAGIDFGARIAAGENFDAKVGGFREKAASVGGESEGFEPSSANEGHIRRATVAVFHPETEIRAEHGAEARLFIVGGHGGGNARDDEFVLEIVFRAHDQFAIDQLVRVRVGGQRLKIFFGPDLCV